MHNPPDGPGDRIPGEQSNRRLRLRHEGQENIKKGGMIKWTKKPEQRFKRRFLF